MSNCSDRIDQRGGDRWRFRDKQTSAYQLEHEHLIASIRAGDPINEAQAVAESTMTGIIGREAVYSGQAVEWDAAMQSTKRLGPPEYAFGAVPDPRSGHAGTISTHVATADPNLRRRSTAHRRAAATGGLS